MVTTPQNPTYTLSVHPTPATSSPLHVSPVAKIFCEIINNPHIENFNTLLSSSGIKPSVDVIEEVLKLSYGSPEKAYGFFKWAELGTNRDRSGPVCELMIDLLGSNGFFEEMWDLVKGMKGNEILSKKTFSLVFRSYCGAGRVDDAIIAFYNMDAYGFCGDVKVVNDLLSEIVRVSDGTEKLFGFFDRVKDRIKPDFDTYAVIMEGLEKEGNVKKAKSVFDEMLGRVGWDKESFRVYDAFLVTLFNGSEYDEAVRMVEVMKKEGCFPGLRFFSVAISVLYRKRDLSRTSLLWSIMVDNGVLPNVGMFNSIVGLYCNNNDIDCAFRYLDEMVVYGAFPDSVTYNTIFRCLVKNKQVREAGKFFVEMTKNEFPPTHLNCAAAIALFFDGDDPEMALEVWYYMVNNRLFPFEESANMLLIGLCNLGRLTELKRIAEKMLDRNIHISEATMAKIKQAFQKRSGDACDSYNSLSRKWKLSL